MAKISMGRALAVATFGHRRCSQSGCSISAGCYPHVSGHRSLENLIKPWEHNVFRSLKETSYHVACLAPRGDNFAPTVTELSVNEYGFLETPEYMPKFAGGGKVAKMLIKTVSGAGCSTRDCETPAKQSTTMKLWCDHLSNGSTVHWTTNLGYCSCL